MTRCPVCHTTGTDPHPPDGDTCRAMQDEREAKRRDDW